MIISSMLLFNNRICIKKVVKVQIKPVINVIMPGAANLRSSCAFVLTFRNYYNC